VLVRNARYLEQRGFSAKLLRAQDGAEPLGADVAVADVLVTVPLAAEREL
jgi:hypothetical protein